MTHDKIPELLQRLDEAAMSSLNHDCAATIRQLLSQLPAGMQHRTFEILECEKGHSRIHPTTWVDHGCRVCTGQKLQKELEDVRAKALAAVWSMPEGANHIELIELYAEARDVFMGKDKQTIAALQDRIANLEADLRKAAAKDTPNPGVNAVYGVKRTPRGTSYDDVRIALALVSITREANGAYVIEVQLP